MTVGRFVGTTVVAGCALSALAVGVALAVAPGDVALGVALGALLGAVNLSVIGWLCGRAVSIPARRGIYLVAVVAKFVVFVAAAGLLARFVAMDMLGFLGGLTASTLAIVGAAGWAAGRKEEIQA